STYLFTSFAFILILLSTFLTRSGILGDSSVHSFTGADMLGQLLAYMMFFIWLTIHLVLFNRKQRIYLAATSIALLLFSVFLNTDYVFLQGAEFAFSVKSLLFALGILSILLFIIIGYATDFPKEQQTEENFSAREFWMFIAAIILCLSAFHIIINTAKPALNAVFATKWAIAQDERNAFYNMYQVPFAIVISLIMAFTQFLKYRKSDPAKFFKEILISFGLSLVAAGLILNYYNLKGTHVLLLFTSVFAVVANLDYFLRLMKGKLNHLGSSIAHIGFGLVLLGALISQARQQVISKNYKGYVLDLLDKERSITNEQDVQLFKGELTSMGDYFVVYTGKTMDRKNGYLYFNIDYIEQLPKSYKKGDRVVYNFQLYECNADHPAQKHFNKERNYWKPIQAASSAEYYSYPTWESHRPGKKLFDLRPFVQLTDAGRSAEPGTKSFWSHDIFTHLKHGNLSPANTSKMAPLTMQANIGDTLWTAGYKIRVAKVEPLNNDTSTQNAKLTLEVYHILDDQGKYPLLVQPAWQKNDSGMVKNPVAEIKQLGLEFRLLNVNSKSIDTSAANAHKQLHAANEKNFSLEYVTKEYVVLHATKFPMIIILWWGCIIMCAGTFMAVIHRIRKNKIAKS
ncbi:MAG TPA: cytochrome c-type biogenesis CcmF C-terminal domain-containing protein, partial [Flavobacteriales bacterium]|nr:cytochrome c-type biogenesis CcmF C-terminal domain-containing protein [Flavobacteriales bacterium]